MFRRYAPVFLIIIAISLGSAFVAYKASAKREFKASCAFQAFVRVQTALPQPTSEFLTFSNTLAFNSVAAAQPAVYLAVAQAEKVSPPSLLAQARLTSAGGVAAFALQITDADGERAKRVANELCDQFVIVIAKQRAEDVDRQIKVIRGRMAGEAAEVKRLSAIPPKKRSPTDRAALGTQQTALTRNALLIATLLSLPPDNIGVLRRAENAQGSQTASLRKNVVIALVAGLLAFFLVVLIGEVSADNRRRRLDAPEHAVR